MMNPNRIVNIYSFHAPEEYTIPGTDVVVRCGRSTIVREEKTYILTSGNDVYGKFSIDLGHFLFKFLRGDRGDSEFINDK